MQLLGEYGCAILVANFLKPFFSAVEVTDHFQLQTDGKKYVYFQAFHSIACSAHCDFNFMVAPYGYDIRSSAWTFDFEMRYVSKAFESSLILWIDLAEVLEQLLSLVYNACTDVAVETRQERYMGTRRVTHQYSTHRHDIS